MKTERVEKLNNGTEIHRVADGHGAPRYRVKRGTYWIGKTRDGGYISARAAKRFAVDNG